MPIYEMSMTLRHFAWYALWKLALQARCAVSIAAGRAGAADRCQRGSVLHGGICRCTASPHSAECHPAAVQDLPGGHAHAQPHTAHRSALPDLILVTMRPFTRRSLWQTKMQGRPSAVSTSLAKEATQVQVVEQVPLSCLLCYYAGLLEQEQWTPALVARDFQRSIDGMEHKAQAFLHTNGNGDSAHLSHVLPASANGQVAKHLQNVGTSAPDKGMACAEVYLEDCLLCYALYLPCSPLMLSQGIVPGT